MWNINGKPANFSRFQPFEPAEVLYEFDGPRIFTLTDNDDELNLVYWSGCQRVEFEDIPRDSLPGIGTMLLPSLEPQLLQLEGRIRELDKDRLSFELREIDGSSQTQRFVFDEELLEEVFQSFEANVRVLVAGRTFPVKNLAYAYALSKSPASP